MAVVPTQRDAIVARSAEKRFQKPITLVFMDPKTDEAITCRIVTLDQLKEVCQKLDQGEIKEGGRFSTLEMQLWAHAAEGTGFLREVRSVHPLAEGLGLLADRGALRQDLMDTLGSEEEAESLIEFAKRTSKRPTRGAGLDVAPRTGKSAFKEDGVNFTPEAEKRLQEMMGYSEVDVIAANAEVLVSESDPGPSSEEMDEQIEEARKRDEWAGEPQPLVATFDLAARIEAATRGGPLADLKNVLPKWIENSRPAIREQLPELAEDFTYEDLEKALSERGLLATEVNVNRSRADDQIKALEDARVKREAEIAEKLMGESKPGLTTDEIENVLMSRKYGLPADEKVEARLDVKGVEDRVIETDLPYEIPEDQDGAPNTIVCRTCGMRLEAAEGQLLSQDEINDFVQKHKHDGTES